ncbi:MAG: 50S ribosomal protein L6 [Patescibacteria group bacterium]|nr:50S ribosomal protein L6 [Patescibacteria group bacterium]
MSRIGKKPILIPNGVEIKIEDQKVVIKGPKGELRQGVPEEVKVLKENNKLLITLKRKTKKSSALWGLIRALLQNQVIGVSGGFEKKLEIIGVGWKASLESKGILKLEVGFSHPVKLEIPQGINVSIEKNLISVFGIDKQKVGEFAAKIRSVRPPEPYQGKGIRYLGEKVRRKEGKKAAITTT